MFGSGVKHLNNSGFKVHPLAVGHGSEYKDLLKTDKVHAGRDNNFAKEGPLLLTDARYDSDSDVRRIRIAVIRRDKHVARFHIKCFGIVLQDQLLPVPRENPVHAAPLNFCTCPKVRVPENIGDRIVFARGDHYADETQLAQYWHRGLDAVCSSRIKRERVTEQSEVLADDIRGNQRHVRVGFEAQERAEAHVLKLRLAKPARLVGKLDVHATEGLILTLELKVPRDEGELILNDTHRNGREGADLFYLRSVVQREQDEGEYNQPGEEDIFPKLEKEIVEAFKHGRNIESASSGRAGPARSD